VWRVQRLLRVQRLRTWRQGLHSLRGLRRVLLRLLHFVGRLPVYLLGANSFPIVCNARGLSRIIASFTAGLPVCMRTGGVGGCIRACRECSTIPDVFDVLCCKASVEPSA
jgi:hypothetical protein